MTIIDGMLVSGWIAKTIYEGELVLYGPFASKGEAESWARHLIQGEVEPIYTPAFNRA